MSIPKKLHFIWIGTPHPPDWVLANIRRWAELNEGWPVKIHNADVLLPEWEDVYRRCEDLCTRSDLLRLSVLRREGGWYFDVDFVPLRPMADIYADHDLSCGCFLTKQWEPGPKRIANGVMGLSTDAAVWTEIDAIIADARGQELERTTFGPLLATRLVQRCPETEVGKINDFYLWRFNSLDTTGKNSAMYKYEALLAGDFSEAAMAATCGEHRPYVVHLWCGGKYDWTPHIPRPVLTASPPPSPVNDCSLCPKCQGRGCADCNFGGIAIELPAPEDAGPMLPPRDEIERYLDAWGYRLAVFELGKIMALPK
jgi:hypothetical protein